MMAQNDFDEIIPTGSLRDVDVDWHASLLDLNFDGCSLPWALDFPSLHC